MAKTLEEHFGYLSDRVKRDRYGAAIEHVVQPGSSVLDLGCGSGLLGLMALEAGAGKVIFVDEGAVIDVARRAVTEAGFDENAEFVHGNSFELALDEPVDVVLCDHVGYFGFDYGILALLADAKARFLDAGGTLVPDEVELRVAPVESDACRRLVGKWQGESVPANFAWLAATAANTKHPVNLKADDLLADAQTLATLFPGDDATPFYSWKAGFRASRDGTLDGVAGWFDCRLIGDVRMTNSPVAEHRLNRPQAFLPLETPVEIEAGEQIDATIMARPGDHVIGWVIELPERGERHALTTFNGMLLDREMLLRAYPERVANLNARGKARLIVLSHCDSRKTVGEIEALVQKNHPDLFPSAQATSAFVRQVLAWDTSP